MKIRRLKTKITLLLPHMNDIQISRFLDCSREYVRQIRGAERIESPFFYQHCSIIGEDKLIAILSDILNTKMVLRKIADKHGISHPWMMDFLKRQGFTFKGREYQRTEKKKCIVKWCDKDTCYRDGYCVNHHNQMVARGRIGERRIRVPGKISLDKMESGFV